MVENSVDCLREELRSKHIYVPDRWLEQLSSEQVDGGAFNFAFCYKKWLDTNLLELNYSNLDIPSQIPDYSLRLQTYPMNATFQLIHVKDAAMPLPNDYCEALYQKKANDYELNEDEEVTGFIENPERDGNQETVQENAENRPVSESKNRHLLLGLHNGKRMFKALEYEPINHLNFQNCYPGAKVSIQGEVLQSLGVLLLRPQNISPLGGVRLELQQDETDNQGNNQGDNAENQGSNAQPNAPNGSSS